MNNPKEKIAPVVKSIQVKLPLEEAFRLFTEGISTWWPLKSHSVGEEDALTCTFEGRAGGRIYETRSDGRTEEWGKVITWEPPRRVVFTWHPGREPSFGTQVEVTFRSAGEGTQVELIHRGWEVLGERAEPVRQNYDSGWDFVLGKYIQQSNN